MRYRCSIWSHETDLYGPSVVAAYGDRQSHGQHTWPLLYPLPWRAPYQHREPLTPAQMAERNRLSWVWLQLTIS